MNWKKAAVRVGQVLVLFVLGYYLIYHNLLLNWHQLSELDWQLRPLPFVLSMLGISAIFLVNTQIWRMVVLAMGGVNIRPWRAAYVWFISNLGRYLPGKVWQIAGMAVMARAEGLSAMDAAASSVLNHVLVLLAGGVVGLALFPASLAGRFEYLLQWTWLAAPLLLVFLHPGLLNRLLDLAARLAGKPPMTRKLRFRDLLVWFVLNALVWLGYGLCFHWFILSVIPSAGLAWADSAGIYAVGYIIGFLVLIAPGGIGVREFMFTGLLTASLGSVAATVVALVSRIWLTLAELVPVAVLLAVGGLPGKKNNTQNKKSGSEQ